MANQRQIRSAFGPAWLCAAVLGLLLAGCATPPPGGVPVVDRNQRAPVSEGSYLVRRGDTLSSIAIRFGWDWRALAQHNGISAPYVIHPGQRIVFGNSRRATPAPGRAPVPAPAVKPTEPAVQVATVPDRPPLVTRPPEPQPPATPIKIQPVERSASGWAWPANGAVIGRFSSNGSLNKGIDIAGELGQPVLAASDGTVVYAGSGLRGYGELVIIKHSDTYVSAYGHNRRLLVREGQKVKAGQTIAEMGSTGTDRVKLHFEIRRQGKPVDPQQYLPRR
ncbi:peptidoglycan DD-metalloendopeptidase family protein [Stutzerimonas urumqiensis]|uniref:peptidoglycan DD-metalloendopeptidase family protein n=1 Tax=Stutzerimonas urumqiensis TaxID=638269 RepID=UPI000EB03A08|nr:peptidoglycan DD-metalloendopeptidase family protein [Stutzerimonas urumqiensis]